MKSAGEARSYSNKSLKVLVLGLRGFPNVQGGVETHAENLCQLLVKLGCQTEVVTRTPYQSDLVSNPWKGVYIRRIWAPRSKSLETVVHTLLGILYATIRRPDILHIQAIGPALLTPLARMLGLRVVVTHHGPDYDRQKWGRLAKWVLKTGEKAGMRYANERIVISKTIRDLVSEEYNVNCHLIPNGVELPVIPETTRALAEFSLVPQKYALLVGRLVPEKRHLDLIEAFSQANLPDWKLVLVGSSEHPGTYSLEVEERARNVKNVVATGFQKGLALRELYAHAGFFVLPSSHEGLPIAMLEALSYGLPVLASDIPANREVGLDVRYYFPLGNIGVLSQRIAEFASACSALPDKEETRQWVAERFDWEHIAEATKEVYISAIQMKRAR